jgi:hypothetical protein
MPRSEVWMGVKLAALLQRIRAARGPFFVARLHMRLDLPPEGADDEEYIRELLAASRKLGYDPLPEGAPPR